MKKAGQDRSQLQMWSLESAVRENSMVRVVEAFVGILNLEELGFKIKGQQKNGAPAYECADILKLYYYGYLNRVRSSRRLEREAITNVEAMWLVRGLLPCYKTIANFRKDNKQALNKAFYELNKFLKGQDLFDEDKVSIDGSKYRAQNSKKNNYNEKKVNQHLDYINKQSRKYLEELDRVDESEKETESEGEQRLEIADKLDRLDERKQKYLKLKEQIERARELGQTQVSTVDPDSRALPKKMNIIEVGYNVLTSAEMKNKLITNFEVSNKLDTYALSGMALEARKVLGKKAGQKLTVLADKGFDTGSELKICIENDIETLVAPKKRVHAKKSKQFNKDQFHYEADHDEYICPQGQHLKTNGRWYKKNNGKHRKAYKVKHYKLPYAVCKACPHRMDCAGESNLNNSKGRYIERSEYQEYIDENIKRVKLNKELYRKRQESIEHQFGTIKRQWGYDYTLLKTKEKVKADFAIIFTVYNLRRTMSILGIKELIRRLKASFLNFWQLCYLLKLHHTIFNRSFDEAVGHSLLKNRFIAVF